MNRCLTVLLGGSLILPLAGCGDSCESLKAELAEIGQEIQKNPESAWDRKEELKEIGDKMREMGCR